MTEKECISCGEIKPIFEFSLKTNPIIVRYTKCEQCRSKHNKQYYLDNKEKMLQYVAARTKILKDYVLNYLSNCTCVDCGRSDIRILEFDHIRDKKNDINVLINRGVSLKTLQDEIEKCEVVCGNCHRIRTDERIGTYRTMETSELMADKLTKSPSKRTKLKKQFKLLEIFKQGCKDCGCSDVRVLEFDHVKRIKDQNISRLLSNNAPWIKIQDEIKKCEVVCRNCHVIRERTKDTKTYRKDE